MREHQDVVVIGGGQAGLAMSRVLGERGFEHIVLERRRIAERWRTERWDSLRFQFPNWSLQLPGYGYTGVEPDGFAHYREILGVLEEYAGDAPVREHSDVLGLAEEDDGRGFVVSLAEGSVHAQRVVIATGPFQRPLVPPMAHDVSPSVLQIDPTRYRCPEALPAGAVLVVGSGASGCQIADELQQAGRKVYLSVSRHRRVPRRFRGRDVYWWLERMGRFAQTIDSFPSRRPPPSTVITGMDGGYDVNVRQLAADGASVIGRITGASGEHLAVGVTANQILDEADKAYADFLSTARQRVSEGIDEELAPEESEEPIHLPAVEEVGSLDLGKEKINAIVWATGYAHDFAWVKVPVFDDTGRPIQQRGVSSRPGLYFLGLHWMHTFKSGLLSGVGADAEHLVDHMARPR